MRTLPVALRAYLWAIYAAAIAVVAIEVARAPAHLASGALLTQAAVFCLVAYACEFTEVRIAPGLAQTVVTTAHIATILLFPPPAPVVIALVAASAASLRDRDLPLFKRAFNVAHAVLIVGVNSAVFARTIGGAGPLTPREVASLFPSAVLLLGLYYALDVGLYLGVRAIPARVAIWTLWASTYPSTLLPELAASSIGILVAVTWRLWPALIALFIVPVIALNLTFRAIAAADRRTDGLRHVLAIAEKMEIKRWDPSELMRQVAAAARAVAEAETATVYMLDPDDTSRFERIAIVPRDADSCGPSHIPVAATATRTDADEGRHVRPARDRMGDLFAVPGARVVVLPIEAEPGSDALILLSGVPAHVESVTRDTLTILSAAAASAWRNVLAHQHVRAQAAEDGLTGLLNHRTFHLSLENEVVRAQRSARVLSLIMVDVDNFGQINNAHGHQAGDAVLRAVAEMLRAASRTSDLAARYGGDEFAIILPEATTEDALDVAERARGHRVAAHPPRGAGDQGRLQRGRGNAADARRRAGGPDPGGRSGGLPGEACGQRARGSAGRPPDGPGAGRGGAGGAIGARQPRHGGGPGRRRRRQGRVHAGALAAGERLQRRDRVRTGAPAGGRHAHQARRPPPRRRQDRHPRRHSHEARPP